MFSAAQLRQLKHLHAELLDRMTYQTDQEKFGKPDYWEGAHVLRPQGPFRGDCEEFAMLAVQRVQVLGLPGRLVTCWDETGAGHCIAEVASEDFQASCFLDNRQLRLATRQDLHAYRFYAVSPWNPVPGDTRAWHKVVP